MTDDKAYSTARKILDMLFPDQAAPPCCSTTTLIEAVNEYIDERVKKVLGDGVAVPPKLGAEMDNLVRRLTALWLAASAEKERLVSEQEFDAAANVRDAMDKFKGMLSGRLDILEAKLK